MNYSELPLIAPDKTAKNGLNQLKNLFSAALESDSPVALWQLPENSNQHLIIDLHHNLKQEKLNLEEISAGFAVGKFLNPNLEKTYFIHADLHYCTENPVDFNELSFSENCDSAKLTRFKEKLLSSQSNYTDFRKYLNNQSIDNQLDKDFFLDLVKKSMQDIQQKKLQKVVLSRTKSISYPTDFEPIKAFEQLSKQYPRAFCYLFYLPQVGVWMGASPETLIGVDRKQIFHTVALAGTQAYHSDESLYEAVWAQKEIEEQAMVSRYIVNCFKKIRLREYEEEGPKTVVAGNLMHLKTHFSVDTQAVNFPQLGSVMLDLLHPTSAVCGSPKESSLAFILENEGYAREFYSGFLGPVNIEAESHIFVNLRCVQFFKNQILLYAGAGIMEDSIPEKEWRETEMKFNTMLAVFKE